jgi:cytochrome c oxidase cbb3-type subunit 3/ubiquinol-cytochrome c reductase cytochrome c subunit
MVRVRPIFVRFVSLLAAFSLSLGCIKRTHDSRGDAATGPSSATDASVDGSALAAAPVDAGAGMITPAQLVERGKVLYGRYCDFCHGKAGQGYAADEAPAIANQEFLSRVTDDYLDRAITRGRPGTTMSAWSNSRGGPLNEQDVRALIKMIRTWQTTPEALEDSRQISGDAKKAEPVYAAKCASCHGKGGHDGKYIALGNPELLASATNGFLASAIEHGRPGTPMLPFAGKLSPQTIGDLVTLVRSWQKPPEELVIIPPKPGQLGQVSSVVINPKGPAPTFDEKADFIPVDTVKKEIERGASLIIADARAPSDYVRSHVAGAISVPFYEVEKYSPEIPKDKWILTYCACPHAASVKSREAFRAKGYKHVAVLDEGILVWRDRGYPTRGGAKP